MARVRGGGIIRSTNSERRQAGDQTRPQAQSQSQSTAPSQPQLHLPIQPQLYPPTQQQLTAPSQLAPYSQGVRVDEHTQPQPQPQSTDPSQWAPNNQGLRVGDHTQPQHQLQWQFTGACTVSDAAYFKACASSAFQREINKDPVWMKAYKDAIWHHQGRIRGKIVMDVGCGTGILSIFCAQAGAKRVYAVDASNIAEQAAEIVIENNLDGRITVLHARVEDIEINGKVDVIISNWMGHMLLYEGMLGSVITARDRWLKPGGLILPSEATLYMAPITDPGRYSESIGFWRSVYGIDMSAIMQHVKQCEFGRPCVGTILAADVLTSPPVVRHVDCFTVGVDELKSVTTEYRLQSMIKAPMHGFAFWFAVGFSGLRTHSSNPLQSSPNMSSDHRSKKLKKSEVNEAIILSTAPKDAPTHWKQTMVYLPDPIELDKDQLIEGSLTISQPNETPRRLHIQTLFNARANPLDSGQG